MTLRWRAPHRPWLPFASALLGVACGNSGAGGGALANQACTHSSDCKAGLVCAYGVCSTTCTTLASCGTSASCVDDGDAAVCVNAAPCNTQADCPTPLACTSDYSCRNLCNTNADCAVLGLSGEVCATDPKGAHVCAGPSQADASGE